MRTKFPEIPRAKLTRMEIPGKEFLKTMGRLRRVVFFSRKFRLMPYNRLFLSSLLRMFPNTSSWETIHEIEFCLQVHFHANQTPLQIKDFVRGRENGRPPLEISGNFSWFKVPVMTVRDTWSLWCLIGRWLVFYRAQVTNQEPELDLY